MNRQNGKKLKLTEVYLFIEFDISPLPPPYHDPTITS